MRYMLMICRDESMEVNPAERASIVSATKAWVEEMDGRGVRVFGHALQPISDATTVRARAGDVFVADGPFAETKEQIAGFDVIECRDLDEAIEVASKHPVATLGTIEVRPFWTE